MLDSLIIINYRNLSGLEIPKLARVNLLTGKNNTGKTSVLEAVWLYHSQYDANVLIHLLKKRDELHAVGFEALKKSLRNLASNRRYDENNSITLKIGSIVRQNETEISLKEKGIYGYSPGDSPVISVKPKIRVSNPIVVPLDKFSPKEPFIVGDESHGLASLLNLPISILKKN